jgi:hypothetical protein
MFGYNLDSMGDSKLITKGSAAWSVAFKYLGFGAGENGKHSELLSRLQSLHLTRSAVCM